MKLVWKTDTPPKFVPCVVRRDSPDGLWHSRAQWTGHYWYGIELEEKYDDVISYVFWDEFQDALEREHEEMNG